MKSILLGVALLALIGAGPARADTAVFPFAGGGSVIFPVPQDVFQISAELWAGGGAGSLSAAGTAGAFAFGSFSTTPGETLSVFTGGGGLASFNAGAGGDSSISRGATLLLAAPGGGSGGAGFVHPDVLGGAVLVAAGQTPFGTASASYSNGIALGGNAGFGPGRDGLVVFAFTPSPIPEPEIYGMLLAGFGLLGFVARRRTRSAR